MEAPTTAAPVDEVRTVVVEGVGSSRHSAPIAALREIGERVFGRSFSIVYGRHIAFGEEMLAPSLDTRRKRVLSVEETKTGLYKAIMEVEIPADSPVLDKTLRERIHRGEGEILSGGGIVSTRELAREDAMEKAILAVVAERYPGDSYPNRLTGRVFFLGTLREEIKEGNYEILARTKVWLVEP